VARPHDPAGVHAVDDLADRAERAVEAQLSRELVDDLLQRRRDDVDRLAALVVLSDEPNRILVDEGLEDRFHRVPNQLLELADAQALQDHHSVLGSLPHGRGARAAGDEEELPGRRLGKLGPSDQPALAEGTGKCERARAL